jgi:purine-binding chemotaxis protein CheW
VPLPGAPPAIEGVINLRGSVVCVLDIRRRLHLPPRPLEHTDHFLITRVSDRLLALRVDHALDLVQVAESDIDAVGELGARVARLPNDLVLIQDLGGLLSASESAQLETAEGRRP